MKTTLRRVVVTGIGAITPIGKTAEETFANMRAGVCGIKPITAFDCSEYKAKLAAEVSNFDPREYMEKADVLRTDRYTQFALAAAKQAVADSGVIGTLPKDRVAVYFGSGIGGISTFTEEHTKLLERGPKRISPHFIPRMIANMAAGMIAIRYGCEGAAMPTVTACASGSNAIGEALRAIRHGYADAVITGGSEAAIDPCGIAGFINMQALSVAEDPTAASLPFDSRRGGFVMGEGGGALVLEEYEHAKKRGAKIYGEVCGYGSTCDAYHMTAPRPDADGGARAMKQALTESGLTEEALRSAPPIYVNAHGTGTPLNDVAETKAIKAALGEEAAQKAYVSSTKAVTGHLLGAAGAVEAIACLLALRDGVIPPTANLLSQDPQCDLNCVPCQEIKADITFALSNSLGFGGHNACLAFRKVCDV